MTSKETAIAAQFTSKKYSEMPSGITKRSGHMKTIMEVELPAANLILGDSIKIPISYFFLYYFDFY